LFVDASSKRRHVTLGSLVIAGAIVAIAATTACTESGKLPPGQSQPTLGAGDQVAAAAMICTPPATDSVQDGVCSRWACAHAELVAAPWDGDANQCSAGTMDANARERAFHLINAYRSLARVPELTAEPRWDAPAQDCALLAHANQRLSHFPSRDWSCWSDRGARASAVSLVANRSAPLAIDPFIEDPGNEPSMVHRRWLLSERIHRIGLGSTSRFSCALVDGREWDGADTNIGPQAVAPTSTEAIPSWVAWPPPGPVPFDVWGRTKLDAMGWTVQSSSLDLDGASVVVRVAGETAPRPLRISGLERTLGSLTAIRFVPDGWSTEPGTRYDVHVEKEGVLIDFAVEPIDCP
jgi:hypothetical protein